MTKMNEWADHDIASFSPKMSFVKMKKMPKLVVEYKCQYHIRSFLKTSL